MNRLFHTLRSFVEKPKQVESGGPAALPGFDNRIEVLSKYAERASAYEEELERNLDDILDQLAQLHQAMEMSLDSGRDRDALEYLRLAMRLRPQRELLEKEIKSFGLVANELRRRIETLLDNLDAARELARDSSANPAAARYLDVTLNRLTRHFVMLERVAVARHRELPQRLVEQMMVIIDDRQLDLELAHYILSRRRALGSGQSSR